MILKEFFKPDIETVQMEVSSNCNASCFYCPLTAYKGKVNKQFIDVSIIENLIPQLRKNAYIHLQGWGEPFMHPDFFQIVKLLKENNFRIGTTTNGMLLNDSDLEEIVDLQVDYIAFSTAGFTPVENNFLRRGTSLEKIIELIIKIKKIKKFKNSAYPKIHLANIGFNENLDNILDSKEFLEDLKPDQVVVSSVSFFTNPSLDEQALINKTENEWKHLKKSFEKFREVSALDLNFHIVSPFILRKTCSEKISRSVFIGSSGDVHPCVFKGLPLSEKVNFFIRGMKREHENLSFGNLFHENLKKIWNKKEYRKFRKGHVKKDDFCRICYKRSIDFFEAGRKIDLSSYDCKWDIIRESNEESQDRKRLGREMANFLSN